MNLESDFGSDILVRGTSLIIFNLNERQLFYALT